MTLQILINLILRHALTAVGGAGITEGLLSNDVTMQIAGGLSGLVGIFFSVLDKKKR
jgi:hypothetical protein